jgi:H+/Cl- antiporter ClcA
MNKLMKRYWTPTPKKWRKIGDSLLAVSTVLAIGGLWQFDNLKDVFTPNELKIMIVLSLVLGVIGKFLTNFFVEDIPQKD